MIKSLIDAAVIVDRLQKSAKDDVLQELLAAVVAEGRITARQKSAVRSAIAERERLGSTGIGNGVAVPHVKLSGKRETVLALGRHADGVAYDAIDGRPVHTVFLLIGSTERADQHLEVLRWISSLARNSDFRRFVMGAGGVDDIRDLLHEMSATA